MSTADADSVADLPDERGQDRSSYYDGPADGDEDTLWKVLAVLATLGTAIALWHLATSAAYGD